MGSGLYGGFGKTKGTEDAETTRLIDELEKTGAKYTKEDIVFITRDEQGRIVWLEKGNSSAGLEHILNGNGKSTGHAADFEKAFGVSRTEIPLLLKNIISNGKIVSDTIKAVNGRTGYERVYYYDGVHYLMTGIGTNGFIVTAYPIEY